MADDLFATFHDLLTIFSKAGLVGKPVLANSDALLKSNAADAATKLGAKHFQVELQKGLVVAETEAVDGSSDVGEHVGHASAASRARHRQFNHVFMPAMYRMFKNSVRHKVVWTSFALATLHLLPENDFNFDSVVKTALIASGVIFGVEVARDLWSPKHKADEHTVSEPDIEAIILKMKEVDFKATRKMTILAGLNFYDSSPLTQGEVFGALALLSTVGLYGLFVGIKYAEMKGLDWKEWETSHPVKKYLQKSQIPKLAGYSLLKTSDGIQNSLPYLGRTAKAVASGRLFLKGFTMFAPIEEVIDMSTEHLTLLSQLGTKGAIWGGTGIAVGSAANVVLGVTRKYGNRIKARILPSRPDASTTQPALTPTPSVT